MYETGAVRSALPFKLVAGMKRFTEDESSLDVNLSLRCNDLVQRGQHRGCAEGSRDLGLQHKDRTGP